MRPLLGVTKDDDKVKPAIPKLYDYTKGGTDIVDLHIGMSERRSSGRCSGGQLLAMM